MKIIKDDKYFIKNILVIFLVFILFANIILLSLYLINEYLIIEKIKLIRTENLSEINNMYDYIDKSIILLSINLIEDENLNKSLNYKDMTNYNRLKINRRLSELQSISASVHSIYIYDKNNHDTYSSLDNFNNLDNNLFNNFDINRFKNNIFLFDNKLIQSYIFYMDEYGDLIVSINVDLNWINRINIKQDSEMFLFNNKEDIVYSIKNKSLEETSKGKNKSIFDTAISSHINGTDWVILNTTNKGKQSLYKNNIKKYIILLNLAFILVSWIISLILSRRINQPIKNLANTVFKFKPNINEINPDIISIEVEKIIKENAELIGKITKNEDRIKKEILKEIIVGNITGENISNVAKKYKVDLEEFINVYLIYCYNGNSYLNSLDDDLILYRFNENNNVFFILKGVEEYDLLKIIEKMRYLGVNHIVRTELINGIHSLNKEYLNINDKLRYRIFYPNGNIFNTNDTYYEDINYPTDIEYDVIDSLIMEEETFIENYTRFFNHISLANYDTFKVYNIKLFFSIRNYVSGLMDLDYYEGILNLDNFNKRIINIDTSKELLELFRMIHCESKKLIESYRSKKNREIVDKALDIININYKNRDFSISDIGNELNLSNQYLNQLAKKELDISFSQYIVIKRIEESKELLLSTDLTIKEIAIEVGFNNDNYFYQVFKNKESMTPGEYRKDYRL